MVFSKVKHSEIADTKYRNIDMVDFDAPLNVKGRRRGIYVVSLNYSKPNKTWTRVNIIYHNVSVCPQGTNLSNPSIYVHMLNNTTEQNFSAWNIS